jgi:hypothetical protein
MRGASASPPSRISSSLSSSFPDRRKIGFPLFVAVLILAGVGLVWLTMRERGTPPEMPEGVQTVQIDSMSHVDPAELPVHYHTIPPAGGPHLAQWQNCGFYTEPVISEAAVHSLEHGAVWITHDPDLASSEIRELRRMTRISQYTIVSPWADGQLPSPVVASVWGYQLHLDSADDDRLEEFVRYFRTRHHAPEPHGACHGGIGDPE